MLLLITLYLLLVVVLPLALSALVSYRTLPQGTSCPLCRSDTMRLLARWLNLVNAPLRGASLHRRWCPGCGWEGVVRLNGLRPALRIPRSTVATRKLAPTVGTSSDAMDVRNLEVDGRPWRVLLQCWSDTGTWHGRLLFIAASGRLWADRAETLSGASPDDVLGQALAIPDFVLAGRLRDLTSA